MADKGTVVYDMRRGGKVVAQVVVLRSGKCVVSWPTSTTVYDSVQMAQAVHIQHMGGRGESTSFVAVWSDTKSFMRGWWDASQDHLEGAPFASATDNYRLDEIAAPDWEDMDPCSWVEGYVGACDHMYTELRRLCAEHAYVILREIERLRADAEESRRISAEFNMLRGRP